MLTPPAASTDHFALYNTIGKAEYSHHNQPFDYPPQQQYQKPKNDRKYVMTQIKKLDFVKKTVDAVGLPVELCTGENASKYVIATQFLPKKAHEKLEFKKTLHSYSPRHSEMIAAMYKTPVYISFDAWKSFLSIFPALKFNNTEKKADISKNNQIVFYYTLTGEKKESLSAVLSKIFTMYLRPQHMKSFISASRNSNKNINTGKTLEWTDYWTKVIGPLDRDIGEINRKMKEKYPLIDEKLILYILDELEKSGATLTTEY